MARWRSPMEHARLWRIGTTKYLASWRKPAATSSTVSGGEGPFDMDAQRKAIAGMGSDMREMKDRMEPGFKQALESRVGLMKETVREFAKGYREGLAGGTDADKKQI
mgnify:CR=1 FL=1